MKKLLILFLLVGTSLSYAQISEPANVKNVILFRSGAELEMESEFNLKKGTSEILLSNLPKYFDENSIRVKSNNDVEILSINKETNYLDETDKPDEIIKLENNLKKLENELEITKGRKTTLSQQYSLIIENKKISGNNTSVSVTQLEKMVEYFGKKLNSINEKMIDVDSEIEIQKKEIDNIKKQLSDYNANAAKYLNEIRVKVLSKKAQKAKFNLKLFVNHAGWNPVYDIRVKNIESDPVLTYNANIWQNCGISWNESDITLSTRNPKRSGVKPQLYSWYLDFEKQRLYRKGQEMMKMEADVATAAPNKVKIESKYFSTEFGIPDKKTIKSDGKKHLIRLKEESLKADYQYYCAPKLDNNAYLTAVLKDFNSKEIIPGTASVYFEGSYVGKAYLNTSNNIDDLTVSLGYDEDIDIKRTEIKNYTEEKALSSDVEQFFTYEIEIKNNKPIDIEIKMEENLPISRHEDIEVNLIDLDGGKFDNKNGFLTWELNITKNAKIRKEFSFSVVYPGDKQIQGL